MSLRERLGEAESKLASANVSLIDLETSCDLESSHDLTSPIPMDVREVRLEAGNILER